MSHPQTTVYVSGLSSTSDENTLINAFQPFGEIVEVHLPKQQQHQRRAADGQETTEAGRGIGEAHRGFGFVLFSAAHEAEAAIDNMHLNEIDDRVITVTLAKPFRNAQSRLEGATRDARKAIWDDEDWIKQYGDPGQKVEGQDEGAEIKERG